MKKTSKLVNRKPRAQIDGRRNPLAERINADLPAGFTALENPLSARINFRGSRPCPADGLPPLLESPLAAAVNRRQPGATRQASGAGESPLWQRVNRR